MHTQLPLNTPSNVVNLFTRRPLDSNDSHYLRIAPETEGLEILYSNTSLDNKLFSLKIAFWAMSESGVISAMVPWLNEIIAASELDDPLHGKFEGYREPQTNSIFQTPPPPKALELETATRYYQSKEQQKTNAHETVQHSKPYSIAPQELMDIIGTHVVIMHSDDTNFSLIEVFSWRLNEEGLLQAMLVNEENISKTPVLPGDDCLYPASEEPGFRYFFQHGIANKIKQQDPEALAALSMLVDKRIH